MKAGAATYVLVTTSGIQPTKAVFKHAANNNIRFAHVTAQYKIHKGNLKIRFKTKSSYKLKQFRSLPPVSLKK